MELNEAIQQCQLNNRSAQEWLYRKYFPTLLPLCKRFARDEDDTITFMNDGFMKIFKNLGKLNDSEKLVPWMKKILYHAICDHLRKEKKHMHFLPVEHHEKQVDVTALDNLYEEDILALLEFLPKASSEVFVLYAIHGYNHREIGELKSISEGTSKWHLAEARKKLKQLIKEKLKNNVYAV